MTADQFDARLEAIDAERAMLSRQWVGADHLADDARTLAQAAGEAAWQVMRDRIAAASGFAAPWLGPLLDELREAAVSAAVQSVAIRCSGVVVTDERTPKA